MPSSRIESTPSLSAEQALRLIELVDIAFKPGSLEEFAASTLPAVAGMMQSSLAILYVADSRLSAPGFFSHGSLPQTESDIELLCAKQFEQLSSEGDSRPTATSISLARGTPETLILYPLQMDRGCSGLLGLAAPGGAISASPEVLQRVLRVLANTIDRLIQRVASDRQLTHLNTYLTVSSMLVQSLNLHEMLEGVLYCCLEAAPGEVASVLLLNEDMTSFRIYQIEGPAKTLLKQTTFTLLEDVAAHVLETQQPVIVNDIESDPPFSEEAGWESDFSTRNLIAVPLAIGDEVIGVLEVLNKLDASSFTQDEHMLLLSIADEIALAIRNAKMFEFVANTYCKRRKGQLSCKGCNRPLGAWTPCIEYQEHTTVSGLWQISEMKE